MPSVRVRVPDALRLVIEAEGESLSKGTKERIAIAVATFQGEPSELQAPPPLMPRTSAVVFLNDLQDKFVVDLAGKLGLSSSEVVERLAWWAARDDIGQAPPTPGLSAELDVPIALQAVIDALGGKPRREQVEYFNQMAAFLFDDKRPGVLFAEAATGVGKTIAFFSVAKAWSDSQPEGLTLIAAPTYQLLGQMHDQWLRLEQKGLSLPKSAVIIGQSGFASKDALEQWCNQAPDAVDADVTLAAQAWIAAGAPPREGGLTTASWSIDGLRGWLGNAGLAFEEVPAITVSERQDDEDPGFLAYRAQASVQSLNANLVFMTHAMLAVLVRERMRQQKEALTEAQSAQLSARIGEWESSSEEARGEIDTFYKMLNEHMAGVEHESVPKLPDIDFLIVDEAHQLEEWFAKVNSLDISLWRLLHEAKSLRTNHPKSLSQAKLDELARVSNALSASYASFSADGVQPLHLVSELRDALSAIASGLRGDAKSSPAGRRLLGSERMLSLAMPSGAVARNMEVRIEWSEVRHWPRVIVGRRTVAPLLDNLWRNVAEKSILASATMYVDMPQLSPEVLRYRLAVPNALERQCSPIRPRWVFDPVTIHSATLIKRPDGRAWRFVRGKRPTLDEGSLDVDRVWVQEVSSYIADAWRSADGGMLVLLTSYLDLQAVQAVLAALPDIGPVVAQKSGRPLGLDAAKFMAEVRAGHRPLMLGVGGAWTGLDLHMPDQPNALTDLVIPLIPFGASGNMKAGGKSGLMTEVYNAYILFRQGLGRAVRSPDTNSNRRIHVLDVRRHLNEFAGMCQPINRWLARYARQISV